MPRKDWEKLFENMLYGKLIKYEDKKSNAVFIGRVQKLAVWYTDGAQKDLEVIVHLNSRKFVLSVYDFIYNITILE